MDYKQAISYISSYIDYELVPRLPHNAANYDLRRVFELLARLDNPHLKAKSVHITGSNGKGSVAAMIASALTESGYLTGLYTSPHLHTWRERIMVNNVPVTEAEFARDMDILKPEIEAVNLKATYGRLTTFEILTVLGFFYFSHRKADFQVLEVGMGGRYDATSVITPEVSILTPVSLEHTDVLGTTIAEITSEKAAIIKPGGVAVTAPQTGEADDVIDDTCARLGARRVKVGIDVTWKRLGFNLSGQALRVRGRRAEYELFIPLLGQYQLVNAATAVAALEVLQEKGNAVTGDSIAAGLGRVSWPGRLQVLSREPLLVVDGGHNPGAARRLGEALAQYFTYEQAILVIGVSSDKDIAAIAAELAPRFSSVIATRAEHPRATSPERIAAEFSKCSAQVMLSSSMPEALAQAKKMAGKNDLICVSGSLFLVAQAIESETGAAHD